MFERKAKTRMNVVHSYKYITMQVTEILVEKTKLNEVAFVPWLVGGAWTATKWIAGALALDVAVNGTMNLIKSWTKPNFVPTADNIPKGTIIKEGNKRWQFNGRAWYKVTGEKNGMLGLEAVKDQNQFVKKFNSAMKRQNGIDLSRVSPLDMKIAISKTEMRSEKEAKKLTELYKKWVETNPDLLDEADKKINKLRVIGTIVALVAPAIYWYQAQQIKAVLDLQLKENVITEKEYQKEIEGLRVALAAVFAVSVTRITAVMMVAFLIEVIEFIAARSPLPKTLQRFAGILKAAGTASGVVVTGALVAFLSIPAGRDTIVKFLVDASLADNIDDLIESAVQLAGFSYDKVQDKLDLEDPAVQKMLDRQKREQKLIFTNDEKLKIANDHKGLLD